jgi:hypothetical protein
VNLDNVSRDDWILGGLALLLAICLLFFPWYSVSIGPFSFDRSATSSPYAIWGVLALITSLAVVADLAVERLAPQTTLPSVSGSRTMTRLAIVGVTLVLLVIKFLAHVGDFGWGFFVSLVVALALGYFAWMAHSAAPAAAARPAPASPPPPSTPEPPASSPPPGT